MNELVEMKFGCKSIFNDWDLNSGRKKLAH